MHVVTNSYNITGDFSQPKKRIYNCQGGFDKSTNLIEQV